MRFLSVRRKEAARARFITVEEVWFIGGIFVTSVRYALIINGYGFFRWDARAYVGFTAVFPIFYGFGPAEHERRPIPRASRDDIILIWPLCARVCITYTRVHTLTNTHAQTVYVGYDCLLIREDTSVDPWLEADSSDFLSDQLIVKARK